MYFVNGSAYEYLEFDAVEDEPGVNRDQRPWGGMGEPSLPAGDIRIGAIGGWR